MTNRAEQLRGVVRVEGDHAVLTVAGEIDMATASLFARLLDQAIATGSSRVSVDMAGVDFIDAAGLTVLVLAAQRRRVGAWLRVRLVSPSIYRLFTITGLTQVLDVDPRRCPTLNSSWGKSRRSH